MSKAVGPKRPLHPLQGEGTRLTLCILGRGRVMVYLLCQPGEDIGPNSSVKPQPPCSPNPGWVGSGYLRLEVTLGSCETLGRALSFSAGG